MCVTAVRGSESQPVPDPAQHVSGNILSDADPAFVNQDRYVLVVGRNRSFFETLLISLPCGLCWEVEMVNDNPVSLIFLWTVFTGIVGL